MLSKAFENKCNFMKWLEAYDNVVEMAPFGLGESVLLKLSFIVEAEEFNTSAKLNSTLQR
jgi:hypothetical protein